MIRPVIAALEGTTMDGSRDEPMVVREWRCPTCGSLLFRARITLDANELVESWCGKCKAKVVFVAAKGEVA